MSVGVIASHLYDNAEKYYWSATAAAFAHPATRRIGIRMAGFAVRASIRMHFGAINAILNTPIKYGGKTTIRTAAKPMAKRAGASSLRYARVAATNPLTWYFVAYGALSFGAGHAVAGGWQRRGMSKEDQVAGALGMHPMMGGR